MSTEATIYINHSETDSPLGTSGVDWVEVDTDNDRILASRGSDVVKDGEPLPVESALISAGLVLDGTEKVYDKYFLAHEDGNILHEIFLMGESNNRYVIAIDFDGPTASEPVLEVWDNVEMLTADSVPLGAGEPANSWIKAIGTTFSLPGEDWSGISMAGSSDGHFVWLNAEQGPLSVATTLYFQMKIVIPATQQDAGNVQPILVVKYARV